jgi:hypothetical protein
MLLDMKVIMRFLIEVKYNNLVLSNEFSSY